MQTDPYVSEAFSRHVIYDNILSRLNPVSLIRLARTSRAIRGAAQDYSSRAFNINKRLKRFVSDPTGFRSLQARTASLISGSFALQLFDRTLYPESDLDIYTHPDEAYNAEVGKWLLADGYVFTPNSIQKPDFEEALKGNGGKPVNLWLAVNFGAADEDDLTDIDEGHLKHYGMRGVHKVFTFIRPSTDEYNPTTPAKVQIIMTKVMPLDCILGFHSTCVINFVTYNHAYSIYPKATFEHRESLAISASSHQASALFKYAARGWQIISNPSPLLTIDLARRTRLYGLGEVRFVDDERSWVLSLDTTNVQSPPPLSLTSKPLTWDPVTQNSWELGDDGDGYFVTSRKARTSVLKYPYLVGDDEYLQLLIPFFRAQGTYEYMAKGLVGPSWTWWDSELPVFKEAYQQQKKIAKEKVSSV